MGFDSAAASKNKKFTSEAGFHASSGGCSTKKDYLTG
jgi:hypothetical protein